MPPRRYKLTDLRRTLIKPLMPRPKPGGRWNDHRTTLGGMMRVLKSGSPWRDMPSDKRAEERLRSLPMMGGRRHDRQDPRSGGPRPCLS